MLTRERRAVLQATLDKLNEAVAVAAVAASYAEAYEVESGATIAAVRALSDVASKLRQRLQADYAKRMKRVRS